MKKMFTLICLCLTVLLLNGCNNKQNETTKESSTKTTVTQPVQKDNKEYILKLSEIFKPLNDRIDFDYKKTLVDYDSNFMSFNVDDIKKAQDIYDNVVKQYGQVKDDSFADINIKIDKILSQYEAILKGRNLVLQKKNDTQFMVHGYSQNVVTPVNDAKKLKDSLQSDFSK